MHIRVCVYLYPTDTQVVAAVEEENGLKAKGKPFAMCDCCPQFRLQIHSGVFSGSNFSNRSEKDQFRAVADFPE